MERGNRARVPRIAIVPACEEEAVIGLALARFPAGLFDRVVVAVNGSRDRTAEVARRHGAETLEIEERGYGAACLAALRYLDGQEGNVVFLQADGSEPPAEAARILETLERGEADLVIGSRVSGQAEPGALLPHQRFGNWLATSLIRWLYGYRYTDLGPLRALALPTWRKLGMRERHYGWTVEMQIRALEQGLRIVEVPVAYGLRLAGKNKVSGNLQASLRAGWVIVSVIARLRWSKAGKRAPASPA